MICVHGLTAAAAVALVVLAAAGCGNGTATEPASERTAKTTTQRQPEPTPAAGEDPPPAEAAEIELDPVDLEGLRQVLNGHRGKVVLVDLWATWCAPCVQAFPTVARWQREYGAEGLVVVSLSLDRMQQVEQVVDFLEQRRPPFETYILDVENFSDFVRAFEPEWSGALPAMVIYDRQGNRRHVLQQPHETENAPARFKPLLADGSEYEAE